MVLNGFTRIPASCSVRLRSRVSDSLGWRQFYPDKEQNNRADDRQNESGWVKGGAGSGLGENPRDQATDDRAADAEQRGSDETEMLRPWHNGARNPTDNKADNDRPDNV